MATKRTSKPDVHQELTPAAGGALERIVTNQLLRGGDVREAIREIWTAVVEVERRQPRAGRPAEPEVTE